jgi:ubiquinone/menaquinone biosynthesis C-methylase UbiE
VVETNRPDITPDLLTHKLQSEIYKYNLDLSSTSSQLAYRRSKLESLNAILNDALMMSQIRTKLPNKFARLPILGNAKVQRFLLKIYNFLFKEQRAINLGVIQAVRESINLNQQLSEQTSNLENVLQLINATIETRFGVSDRTIQFLEKNYGDRLRYLQADLAQQKRLITLLLEQQNKPNINTNAVTENIAKEYDSANQTEKIQSLQEIQIDNFYRAFEDTFRGNRSLIRERLQVYIPFLRESNLSQSGDKILDLGSGRGEWLELLRDERYQAMGLDINQAMIQECRELGLAVVEGDALIYLKSLPDNTLGAVTGFHIVEHLPFESLIELIAEAYRVVRPNGLIIFETPNPRNVVVGSCTFYTDPTHKNPIPPEVLQFMINYSGFEKAQILLLNPSEEVPVLEDSAMADRFNQLFYGSMDYAVIGIKG